MRTQALARYFRALGDTTRIRIIEALLERERTVSESLGSSGRPRVASRTTWSA